MKKIFKISSVALSIALVTLVTACNKVSDFGTTNVNPGGTGTPVTAALLTNVLSTIGNYATSVQPGQYAQYFSETQYPSSSLYSAPIIAFSGTYSTSLFDLQNIINQNTDPVTKPIVAASGTNANQIAVARILKAYIFWTITDRWGDIPYSEALKGAAVKLPKYDKQSDIYLDLIKELKEATAQFDNTGLPFKGDILMNYAGSGTATVVNTKWKKFANSLRMLIALRTSKVYPNAGQWAATEFAAALADPNGVIAANSDNVNVAYPSPTFPNPWYSNYVASSRIDNAVTTFMMSTLTGLSDPRAASYGTNTVGFPYGLDRPHAILFTPSCFVLKGTSFLSTDPVPFLTSSVVTLARAEAAERGWTSESAATLYANAITLSFAQFGYSGAQATTYLAQPSVAYGTNNLQKIATQRWIATFPDGIQAWAEWRRTGFPVLTPAQYAVNSSKAIPRRYMYGNDEYSLNLDNVTAAATAMGSDGQDTRVWWDK